MTKDRVRVAVAGAGDFGARHIETLAALPEFDLVAVADHDRQRVEMMTDLHGGAGYRDLAEALDVQRIDAVVIATPPVAHAADLKLALERRLPVLIEKPIVTTSAEVDALAALDEDLKALVHPAHVSRFLPSFVALKERVRDHRIRMIRAVRLVPSERLDLHGGEHPALSAMVHDLDLVRALVDSPLERVSSEQAWADEARPFPQVVAAHLRFADGTVASIENSWTVAHSRQYIDARLEVQADGLGAWFALPAGGVRFTTASGDYQPDVELDGTAYGIPTGALATQLRHFAASASGRSVDRAVTLDDALWSVRTALEIAGGHERD